MDIKKIDIKIIAIIVLGIALIISFMFGQRSKIDTKKEDITILHDNNADLAHKNDSLKQVNLRLDNQISEINKILESNTKQITQTQIELDKLKKRKNEIPTYVNALDADGVANAFSNYLKAKSPSSN